MAYIETVSAQLGGVVDTTLQGGAKKAQGFVDGTLKGAFKAQGAMTETIIEAGAIAGINSSFNQGAQGAGNK